VQHLSNHTTLTLSNTRPAQADAPTSLSPSLNTIAHFGTIMNIQLIRIYSMGQSCSTKEIMRKPAKAS
jgi:hypothetical protein